jgi:hypothetical protein
LRRFSSEARSGNSRLPEAGLPEAGLPEAGLPETGLLLGVRGAPAENVTMNTPFLPMLPVCPLIAAGFLQEAVRRRQEVR